MITRHKPGRLVVCLDLDWRPQFRVDRIPSYKAHRVEEENPDGQADVEEVPDDLSPQVEMIAEILDAFGICTGGADGFEADDVIGTLAARERRDPVVVVSGDRDLLQVVRDEPVPVRVLYLGRGLTNATLMGPAEVAERYGVPADRAGAGYAELALLRGDPSDGLPGVPGIGEKTAADAAGAARLAGGDPGRRRRPQIVAGQRRSGQAAGAADYIEAAGPVVRVATDAPVDVSTADRRPAAGGGRPGAHRVNWRPGWASGHRSRGCRRRSTRCPVVTALLGPTHLVGALVVLERHGHLTLGAVDADVAVEAAALFDRRILTVVALDVFDVLRAVAVGAVGEDLLHAGLRLADVQLGGHEEPWRPEAQHQDHRDDDGGEHADHRADDRPRPLRAGRRLAVGARVLAVLPGLAGTGRPYWPGCPYWPG